MSRILYLCHDNPKPSGGVRTLYRHVEILRGAGFDANIVHFRNGFRLEWFSSDVPVLYSEGGLALAPEDWAVIPEDHCGALEGLRSVGCRKAIFCQGHYQIFQCLSPEQSWRDYGASIVLASSEPIRDFVKSVFDLEVAHVPLSLDREMFSPGGAKRIPQIAFMPRKGAHHLRMARAILHHRAPDLRGVPWIAVEGVGEAQVASIFRQAAFFLATGYREGFGLPPIEAMACGAINIGFRAGGGAEYASAGNGFWVPDEDTLALADEMIHRIRAYLRDPAAPEWDRVRAAGYATAARYDRSVEAERLVRFWAGAAPRARGRA